MHLTRQRKPVDTAVVNNDHENRERAEKIEPRLPFAMIETRIKSGLRRPRCYQDLSQVRKLSPPKGALFTVLRDGANRHNRDN